MEILSGLALAVFLGFIANRMGYLSVHKKITRPIEVSTGGSGGSSSRTRLY